MLDALPGAWYMVVCPSILEEGIERKLDEAGVTKHIIFHIMDELTVLVQEVPDSLASLEWLEVSKAQVLEIARRAINEMKVNT
jgi:hypothetical protein